MQICVVGWYFWSSFLDSMAEVEQETEHSVSIVSHRDVGYTCAQLKSYTIPFRCVENVGLEWGAYQWFLENSWDGESDCLFCHDDIVLHNIKVIDTISKLSCDQSYIFKSREEDRVNGGKHGRGIFMSRKFLDFAKGYRCYCKVCNLCYDFNNKKYYSINEGMKGFYYDRYNSGYSSGKRPEHCRDYNQGIAHYHNYLGRIRDRKYGNPEMDVVNRVWLSSFDSAKRGDYKRYPRGHDDRKTDTSERLETNGK